MDLITIIIIALGLAMDAFAVSITSGVTLKKVRLGYAFRVAFFDEGIEWDKAQKGPGSRIQGWQLLRERLYPEHSDYPMFYVTSNCINWLRTVPTLVRDERNWEDIAPDQEDHAADATRYRIMAPEPYVPSGQTHWK